MFWDSSALVPLLLPESRSARALALMAEDRAPTCWWGGATECVSAIYRCHRASPLPSPSLRAALHRLDRLFEDADVVPPGEAVERRARRLLALHPLRAADALQLAAALVWCGDDPAGREVVCLDRRLSEAAEREGFAVLP